MKKVEKLFKNYDIENHLTNPKGYIKLQILLLFLQNMSEQHASDYGVGADFCNKHNIAWILSNYHIVIDRMPQTGDVITISSWPALMRKIGLKREYRIECNNEVIVRASAQWICLNTKERKLISMLDYAPDIEVIDEMALETSFPRIRINDDEMQKQKSYPVTYNDLDLNQHVNNSCYPVWAFDALSEDWQATHSLKELEIQFKEETLNNTDITVFTKFEEDSIIQAVKKENGNPAALLRSKWVKD